MNENRGLWRGKRIDEGKTEGEWKYGYYVYQRPRKGAFGQQITNADFEHDFIITKDGYRFEVDPSTLGECTGLTDKNGKLIFEGDIIEHKGERYVIKYIEKYMRFSPVKPGTVFAVFDYTQSVIIGNIHDNPELLRRATGEDIGNAAQDTDEIIAEYNNPLETITMDCPTCKGKNTMIGTRAKCSGFFHGKCEKCGCVVIE